MDHHGATSRLGGRVSVASAWNAAANGAVTTAAAEPLPNDVETLKAMLLAERQAHRAEMRQVLQIEKLEQQIAQLRHERFGQSSERRALLDQLELQLFELKEEQAQAETLEEIASPQGADYQHVGTRRCAPVLALVGR